MQQLLLLLLQFQAGPVLLLLLFQAGPVLLLLLLLLHATAGPWWVGCWLLGRGCGLGVSCSCSSLSCRNSCIAYCARIITRFLLLRVRLS